MSVSHTDIKIFIEKHGKDKFSFYLSYFENDPCIIRKYGFSSTSDAEKNAILELEILGEKNWQYSFHQLYLHMKEYPTDIVSKNTLMRKAFHLKKGLFQIYQQQGNLSEEEIYKLIDLQIPSSFKHLMVCAYNQTLDALFDLKNEFMMEKTTPALTTPEHYEFIESTKESRHLERIINNLPGKKQLTIYLQKQKGKFIFDGDNGLIGGQAITSLFHSLTNLSLKLPNSFLLQQEIPNSYTSTLNPDGTQTLKAWIAAYGFSLQGKEIFPFPAEVIEHSFQFDENGNKINLPPLILFKDFNEAVADYIKSKNKIIR